MKEMQGNSSKIAGKHKLMYKTKLNYCDKKTKIKYSSQNKILNTTHVMNAPRNFILKEETQQTITCFHSDNFINKVNTTLFF